MAINPYESPADVPAKASLTSRTLYIALPLATAGIVVAVNVGLGLITNIVEPTPGDADSAPALVLFSVFMVFNLPGLPLYIALGCAGLLPADEEVAGWYYVGCSVLSWTALALGIATILGRWRRAKREEKMV